MGKDESAILFNFLIISGGFYRLMSKEKIVIIGAGEFGEIAYEYFSDYSEYDVVAFAEERNFIKKNELFGLPIIPFENLYNLYSPKFFKVFVAITYTKLNRVRYRLYQTSKQQGYQFVTFIHPTVFMGRDVVIGENCFIFEDNNIQRKVKIGNNVIVWSKNHIGHQSIIQHNCYLASGIIISGYCEIGENSFIGVNCSFNDNIKIGKDNIIGNGAVVTKNTEDSKVYVGNPAKPLSKSSYETFNVSKDDI